MGRGVIEVEAHGLEVPDWWRGSVGCCQWSYLIKSSIPVIIEDMHKAQRVHLYVGSGPVRLCSTYNVIVHLLLRT